MTRCERGGGVVRLQCRATECICLTNQPLRWFLERAFMTFFIAMCRPACVGGVAPRSSRAAARVGMSSQWCLTPRWSVVGIFVGRAKRA
jgi:hypothetical protein